MSWSKFGLILDAKGIQLYSLIFHASLSPGRYCDRKANVLVTPVGASSATCLFPVPKALEARRELS